MMELDQASSPVVVIGQGVNVRITPRVGNPIVGVLYNEVVRFDDTAWNQQGRHRQRTLSDPMTAGRRVILPNQAHGYVYNRYAYNCLILGPCLKSGWGVEVVSHCDGRVREGFSVRVANTVVSSNSGFLLRVVLAMWMNH